MIPRVVRSSRLALAAAGLFVMVGSFALAAHEEPTTVARVSVSSNGIEINGRSEDVDISRDGRLVVFSSEATNLVPDDTNQNWDVFLHDRSTHETTRVSVTEAGEQISGAFAGSLSAEGRYVVFYSPSSTLVEGDTNGRSDVFRKDLVTGEVDLVSEIAGGGTASSSALIFDGTRPISDDGRYVAFASSATEHVPGTLPPASGLHIYVRDMQEGITRLASRTSDGQAGLKASQVHTLSGDGHVVAFETSSALDPRDTNGDMDVYAHNHITGATEWVSTNDAWEPSSIAAWRPDVNYDGTLISFDSISTSLVPRDQGGITPDVFLRDLATDRTEKVSVSSDGAPGSGVSHRTSISSDGRFVSYWSSSANLVAGKTTEVGDVLVRDRLLGSVERVSLAHDGAEGIKTSQAPSISGTGRSIAFESFASNLVMEDTNGINDLFARDIGPPIGIAGLLNVTPAEDVIHLSGQTRATGAELASGTDPVGDLPQEARGIVGDITASTLAYRRGVPQELLLRVRFDTLPQPVFNVEGVVRLTEEVAAPGPVYGVSFTTPDARYEISMNAAEDALITIDDGSRRIYPIFTLYRCAPACIPVKDVEGGFGTAGSDIHFGASLADIGAAPEGPITNIRSFAALGTSQTGGVPLDEAHLPDVVVPGLDVAVGVAPAGAPSDDVSFTPGDVSQDGQLQEEVVVANLAAGDYEAWARTCLGSECAFDKTAFTRQGDTGESPTADPSASPSPSGSPQPEQTTVTFTESSAESGQYSDETLFEARVTDSDGDPIAGATLTFTLAGEGSARDFTAATDQHGVAAVTPRLEEKPGPHQLTVRYPSDDAHAGSAATIGFVVDKEDTAIELRVEGEDDNKRVVARLSDLDSPSDGVSGRAIDFHSDNTLIGSDQTDLNGIATVTLPPRHRGANRTYEAVFEGDDFYLASSDDRPGKGGGQGGEAGGTTQVDRSYRGAVLLL